MPLRHILIADPDTETARLLAPPLRRRGHSVQAVKNGARALELSVLRPPDLVLFDVACPLLDAQAFRQILRSNPRTETVPVLITGPNEERSPTSLKEGFLKKPFNVDEVMARIDQLLRKADAAVRARRGEEGMDGTLGQLSLLDLLQVLGQGRKSGILRVRGPRGAASVHLDAGQVAQSEAEGARGLKSFFRLLSWKDGSFSFTPLAPDPTEVIDRLDQIQKPLEELLLEGLRQGDELAALRTQLPDPATRLALGQDEEAFAEQSAVDAEIIALIRSQATVGEVIDRSRAPDLIAAVALMNLLERGAIVLAPGDLSARPAQRPLLPPGSAHALRLTLSRGRPEWGRARGKILFVVTDAAMLRTFLDRLGGLSYAQIEVHRDLWEPEGFGTLGRLDVTEDLSVDLMQLPTSEAMQPLWQPFAARAVGAVALLHPSENQPTALMALLARELSLPVVLAGASVIPESLSELVPQLSRTSLEPAEALRALLLRAAERTRRA